LRRQITGTLALCAGSGLKAKHPEQAGPGRSNTAGKASGHQPGGIPYLGDSDIDMKTAVGAGMFPIGAGWGFRSEKELLGAGAKAVIKQPEELLEYL